MKIRLILIGMLFFFIGKTTTFSQSYTLDWGSSFSPAWASGNTSGTATNIGGSGINCTVTMSITGGGSFVSPYPRVNNNNSTSADFEVQSSTDALEVDINLNNKTSSFCTITFTFSSAITHLSFGISDVDRPSGSSPWTYVDRVVVSGSGPAGSVTPTLSLFNAGAGIAFISGNVCAAVTGASGANVASLNQGSPDQNGTFFIDFGGAAVTSVTIEYKSEDIPQVNSNPGLQAIAIGNISFEVGVLPVTLADFRAETHNDNATVSWVTENETDAAWFDVEHSTDNRSYASVGRIKAKGNRNQRSYYSFIHRPAPDGINFYRLKMIDIDGSFVYSKVVSVQLHSSGFFIKRLTNPCAGECSMLVSLPTAGTLSVWLFDMSGKLLYTSNSFFPQGDAALSIPKTPLLSQGQYVIRVSNGTFTDQRVFLKQ